MGAERGGRKKSPEVGKVERDWREKGGKCGREWLERETRKCFLEGGRDRETRERVQEIGGRERESAEKRGEKGICCHQATDISSKLFLSSPPSLSLDFCCLSLHTLIFISLSLPLTSSFHLAFRPLCPQISNPKER